MPEIRRDLVGTAMEPFSVEIEKGAIRRFAEAIGSTQQEHVDEAFARALGHEGLVAPPTFATCFRAPADAPWIAPLDRRRIVAGEMSFVHERPIVAGSVVTCRLRLEGIDEKPGRHGPLTLFRQSLVGCDEHARPLFVAGRTTVYRPPAPLDEGRAAARPARTPAREATAPESPLHALGAFPEGLPCPGDRFELVTVPVTTQQLVRYAGASGDFNRIHYDQAYAVEAGLGGVIAHGMLTMAFMGRAADGLAGPRGKVTQLSARFTAPVRPDDRVRVEVHVTAREDRAGEARLACEISARVDDREVALGHASLSLPLQP